MESSTKLPTTAPTGNDSDIAGVWMFLIVYVSIAAVITVVINGLTLFAMYKDPLKCFRNPLTVFITGVVAADFLFGLLGEPIMAAGMAYIWHHGGNSAISGLIFIVGMTVTSLTNMLSFLTLLALAVSQLLATGWMSHYERFVSAKSAKIGVAAIWALTLLIVVVLAFIMNPFVVIVAALWVLTLITIALVVLYIVTYLVFRKQVGQQGHSLETSPVSKEFLKGTFLLVLVQIITVWPYIVAAYLLHQINRSVFPWVFLIVVVLFLAKFFIDPIILVWRIPKYKKSLKVVYASCLARLGCLVETGGEGGVAYAEAPKDDIDDPTSEKVEIETTWTC